MGHPSPLVILEVAVAAPVRYTLTYSSPENASERLVPGVRLLVPLGRRMVTGYLLATQGSQTEHERELKAVSDVLDATPLFPESMVPFYRWVADYYHYPIGEIIRHGLPAGLTRKSTRHIELTPAGRQFLEAAREEHHLDRQWLQTLLERKRLSPSETGRLWNTSARQLLEKWDKEKYVAIVSGVSSDTAKPRFETLIGFASGREGLMEEVKILPSERKTMAILRDCINHAESEWVAKKELTAIYPGARKAITSLTEKGILTKKEQRIYRNLFGEQPQFYPKPEELTAEQAQALKKITKAVSRAEYSAFLLHGVTGSGKTEVYLRAAEAALAKGRTVLLLVPEIALASQLEGHFFSRFGDMVAVLHSGLSAGERLDQWSRLVKGEAKIAIGARSAVFAPLDNIGLVVVDEEHDSAYKQEDGLRYQARDLAILRASQQKAVVVLGSATPSVTSYNNVRQGKFAMLPLRKRIESRPLPQVEIVDLTSVPTVSSKPMLLSPQLVKAIRETVSANEQSLIFLNRRGYANLMYCQQCGTVVQCRLCNVTMTLHKEKGVLLCHYCGSTARVDMLCTNCHSPRLVGLGFGTERIEEELARLFPQARIARLDRDAGAKKGKYLEILRAVRDRQVDILVGTQMITKGHHFPDVTLVGIIWADAGLGLPDYKAGERTFQVIVQVTGRAGRGERPGRVIIQTHQPEHYSIMTAKNHDYDALFAREIELRRSLSFPPFSRLVNFRLEGKKEKEVEETAFKLSESLMKICKSGRTLSLLGPAPAPLARIKGKHRWQVLVKSKEVGTLHTLCNLIMEQLPPAVRSGSVKMAMDVDPENML